MLLGIYTLKNILTRYRNQILIICIIKKVPTMTVYKEGRVEGVPVFLVFEIVRVEVLADYMKVQVDRI